MRLRLVTPPSVEPVTVFEVREQLNITDSDDDLVISQKIQAARAHIENLIGQSLLHTTYDLFLARTSVRGIVIPHGPLASVESVQFLDAPTGLEVLVPSTGYRINPASEPPTILPLGSWPAAMLSTNTLRIRYIAGFSDDPAEVPEALREAVRQLAAWWFEQRETAIVDGDAREIPFGVREIVTEFREWTF